MTPQQQRNLPTTKGRREFWLIGVLVLLGTALRLWGLSRLGLVHFDEGVYAISGLWMITPSPEAQLYAKQILFSPPLYFSLVGASYWIFGKAFDQAAILVNGIIGGATIGVVWWVTRRWLGPGAGIAAAVLVAFGDFHILYSRRRSPT
jgi:predicted membrane-bound mannosyltransferase